MRSGVWILFLMAATLSVGCGTTKWSDSPRTATEQLLVSDAVDRAISEIDFSALEECSVFLDTRFIATTLDQNYVTSTLRQHMLASGCIIKDKPEDADYVVEVRTGALGTNRNDVLLGVPATQLPNVGVLPTGAAAIPEIALSKRTSQQAVCKIAVFAYDRMSGEPVWQSGNRKVDSHAKDTWLLGTGPFQRGNIYNGTSFAGEKIRAPLAKRKKEQVDDSVANSSVGKERRFDREKDSRLDDSGKVEAVNYAAPLTQTPAATPAPASPSPAAATAPPAAATPAPPAAAAPAAATAAPAEKAAEKPAEKPADKPAPEKAAAASSTPAASTTAQVETKPAKPAYTPPVSKPATTAPAGSGLQGELADQKITPVTNPALTTANAIKTYQNLVGGK
jgi:hypothetical protein